MTVTEVVEGEEVEGGTCEYSCTGWPHQHHCEVSEVRCEEEQLQPCLIQVKMTTSQGFWQRATCLSPYFTNARGETVKYSNYPE